MVVLVFQISALKFDTDTMRRRSTSRKPKETLSFHVKNKEQFR